MRAHFIQNFFFSSQLRESNLNSFNHLFAIKFNLITFNLRYLLRNRNIWASKMLNIFRRKKGKTPAIRTVINSLDRSNRFLSISLFATRTHTEHNLFSLRFWVHSLLLFRCWCWVTLKYRVEIDDLLRPLTLFRFTKLMFNNTRSSLSIFIFFSKFYRWSIKRV